MQCQKCQANMVIRFGKFGEFLACPNSNPTDNHGTVGIAPEANSYESAQVKYCTSYHQRYNFLYHSDDRAIDLRPY